MRQLTTKDRDVLRLIIVRGSVWLQIDKKGIIRYIDVYDINKRPRLESIVRELEKLISPVGNQIDHEISKKTNTFLR
jgi:hypothetical protein